MNQPTDRDREKAADLLCGLIITSDVDGRSMSKDTHEKLSLALAQEREEGIKSAPCNCTECWLKRNDKGETK